MPKKENTRLPRAPASLDRSKSYSLPDTGPSISSARVSTSATSISENEDKSSYCPRKKNLTFFSKSEDFAKVGHRKPINFPFRRSPGGNGPALSEGEAPACDELFYYVTHAEHFRHLTKDGHEGFVHRDASYVHLRGVAQISKLLNNQRVALRLRVKGHLVVKPERRPVPRPLILRHPDGAGSSMLKGEGVAPVLGLHLR